MGGWEKFSTQLNSAASKEPTEDKVGLTGSSFTVWVSQVTSPWLVDYHLAHALPVEQVLAEVSNVAGGSWIPPAGLLVILNVETKGAGHSAKVVQHAQPGVSLARAPSTEVDPDGLTS